MVDRIGKHLSRMTMISSNEATDNYPNKMASYRKKEKMKDCHSKSETDQF